MSVLARANNPINMVKTLRFPTLGCSDCIDVVESDDTEEHDQLLSPASFNMLAQVPYVHDRCGGVRPGLGRISTASFTAPQGVFVVPWRGEDGTLHETIAVCDGGTIKTIDGSDAADTSGIAATDALAYIVTDDGKPIVFSDAAAASVATGSAVGCSMSGRLYYLDGTGVGFYEPRTGLVGAALEDAFGATSMCVWRGRLVLFGGDNLIHLSAVLAPEDFDGGKHYEDATRATDIQLAEVGKLGGAVTAFMPVNDTLAYAATRNSLWRLSGDAIGGTLVCISREVGVVAPQAWALGDGGEVAFLSEDGLYFVRPDSVPMPLDVPLENGAVRRLGSLMRPDIVNRRWLMGYDRTLRGYLLIAVGATAAGDGAWLIDEGRSVWPLAFAAAQRPLAMCRREHVAGVSQVLLACADGAVRAFGANLSADSSVAIPSAVAIGPVAHTSGASEDAFLAEVFCELGLHTGLGGANFSVFAANTPHEAIGRAASFVEWVKGGCVGAVPYERFRYALSAGLNKVARPRIRANAFAAVIWNTSGRWVFSRASVAARGCGRIRGQ